METESFEPRRIRERFEDPRLTIGPSKIFGRGIIATAHVRAGEVLMRWGGIEVPKEEYRDDDYHALSTTPLDDHTYLARPILDTTDPIDDHLNHSCDPSGWLVDEVTVMARRDIKPGEEITVDCATWDADQDWPYLDPGETCQCGSLFCRKFLTPNDYLRPELQERYRGHFSPYIQEKINNTIADITTDSLG